MNRLRELRQKLGCSQTEMAESVGVKQNTWSQWERYLPETLLVMQRLGKKYDISIDYLLELTDNPKRADAEPWTAAALTAAEIISGLPVERQNEALRILNEMREHEKAEQRLRDALYAYRLLIGHEAANRVEQLLASGIFGVEQLRGLLGASTNDDGGSATGDSPIAATETIAKRIKQAREAAGMSQTEAGAAVGLSQSQYSLIERDRSGLTVTRLMKLAAAFGVSPAWLMAETDE